VPGSGSKSASDGEAQVRIRPIAARQTPILEIIVNALIETIYHHARKRHKIIISILELTEYLKTV
jgi:hypothetical protein